MARLDVLDLVGFLLTITQQRQKVEQHWPYSGPLYEMLALCLTSVL